MTYSAAVGVGVLQPPRIVGKVECLYRGIRRLATLRPTLTFEVVVRSGERDASRGQVVRGIWRPRPPELGGWWRGIEAGIWLRIHGSISSS